MTRRHLIGPGVIAIVLVSVLAFVAARPPGTEPSAAPGSTDASMTDAPTGTPRPAPKHEVYGYLPYWEMDETIADHVNETELTTLGLFSVTNQRDGSIDTSQNGYKRITGDLGARLIKDAHERGTRVELVFTSFGNTRNARLFGSSELQDATIASLVALATDLGVDGINVDVEQLGAQVHPGLRRLRHPASDRRRVSANADAQVSVATTAGPTGAAMAAAAAEAGADRIFLMAYDYRTAAAPRAPRHRSIAATANRTSSGPSTCTRPSASRSNARSWACRCTASRGRSPDRRSARPRSAGATRGSPTKPGLLASPPVPPEVDPVEIVEFYAIPPADGATPDPSDGVTGRWLAGDLRRLSRHADPETGPRRSSGASPAPGSGRSASSEASRT